MENKKLTNSMVLGLMVEVLEGKVQVADIENLQEVISKVAKIKEQTDKKNNSGKNDKPTKAQIENQGIKELILNCLSDEPKAIKELQAEHEELNPTKFSNQKISALMRQLVKENKVERVEEKKVAKFKIAIDNSEEV